MRKRRNYDWDIAFEREVRWLPAAGCRDLLGWLRTWRRRPDRVFWIVGDDGTWRRVT